MRLLEGFFIVSAVYGGVTFAIYSNLLSRIGPNIYAYAARDATESTCSVDSTSKSCSFASSPSARFPRYGTPEYARVCPWITSPVNQVPSKDCKILVRPDPVTNNEGISWWVSEIAEQAVISRLLGCELLIDYMPDVKIDEVLQPPEDLLKSDGTAAWAVPETGYDCTPANKCFLVYRPFHKNEERVATIRSEYADLGPGIGEELVRVPQYRFGYFSQISVMTKWKLYREDYEQLLEIMPNFDLETGYSCALESQFRLSKRAEQYQPDLFTNILPTLQDENNLVITVYYRSGSADARARHEKAGTDFVEDAEKHKRATQKILNCALAREEEFLSKQTDGSYPGGRTADFSSIVWMVVSDAVGFKDWIMTEYDGNNTNALISPDRQRYAGKVIRRKVVTTNARGIHTRAKRNTSTADWGEAMIDWFLIGESDIVISSGSMSFGETGALRTHRPVYLFHNQEACSRFDLIHTRGNSTVEIHKNRMIMQ